MDINILLSRCVCRLRVLYAGLSLFGGCGKLGVSVGVFPGVIVGGKTSVFVDARRADR